MSIFDEERKRMGVQPVNQKSQQSDKQSSSIFAAERARMKGAEQTYVFDTKPTVPQPTSIPKFTDIPMVQQMQKNPIPTTNSPQQELKGRDLPVVGPILRGLDTVSENKVLNKIGEIGRMFYTPGAGASAVGTMAQKAENALVKLIPALEQSGVKIAGGALKGASELPKLGDTALGATLREIGTGAITGAPLGAAQYLANEGSTGKADLVEAAKQAAMGAVLGAGGPILGEATEAGLRTLGKAANGAIENTKAAAAATKSMPITGVAKETEQAQQMKGDWFTNLFGTQGLGISAAASTKRISKAPLTTSEQIVNTAIKNDKEGVKSAVAAGFRKSYQGLVDRLSPLKRISNDAYETAMDASRANNIANTIVNDKFVNPEGQVIGEGLTNIFKKVARGRDSDFIDYLTLRHAKTRMERGEKVYDDSLKMTTDKVQQKLDLYNQRYPEFQNIAKEWDQFNDNMLKTYGVNEGLISEDMYTALREKNPNYSPMRRQFKRSEKPGRISLAKTTGSSFSGQKAPIKEVSPTGSARRIVDPRKTTIESAGAWVNAAMRNRTMQSMVDAISKNPKQFEGIAEIVQKPNSKTDLKKLLLDGGEDDFVEALNDDFKTLFKAQKVDGDNIVRAMVKGEPVYIKVHDPEIVKTLIGMGPQASNALIDVMSAFSNATKRGATGVLAPVFAVKGATMDLVQSAIQAKNPAQQVADTVYAIFSSIGDKFNVPGLKNLAEEYRRAGGEYSAALKGDRKVNTNIMNMTRYPMLSAKNVGKTALNTVKAPFKLLESIGDIAENAPRMAAYKGEMRRLGGERTPENVRAAMSQAREITTNFSRKGSISRDLEAFVPYNNAAIQGVYRVVKGLKERPFQTVGAIGALAVLPKMMEYFQFADDPDYQNLPARERYRYLIVNKNDDGTFTKIPLEPAYNSIGELTIEALRKFHDQDQNAFKGALDALSNAWLPPLVTGSLQGVTQGGGLEKSIAGGINSTIFAPAVAIASNQSFTGAPIVSKAVGDRSPEYQYDERTSAIAKQLGKVTGMAPMKVDYLLRSYGGDPARLLLPLTSDVGAGNVRNTTLRNFIVDPTYSNTLTNDFYSAKEKLSQAYRDNQELGIPLPSWYSDDLRKELSSTAKGSLSKRISELNDKKKEIMANKNLLSQQKTEQLRNIQYQINTLYMDINSKLQTKGVPIE